MNKLNYKLPYSDLSKFAKVYAGERERWATATACCFIDNKIIIIAEFLNKKLYLIDISDELIIKHTIDTNYYPDLMDYKDGLIATSCRIDSEQQGAISLYEINDNKINFLKNIMFDDLRQLHGVRIIDKNTCIITCTMDGNERGIFFLDINTEKTTQRFNDFKYYPKDIFLTDNRIFIISSSSRPSALGKVKITDSILYLYSYPELNKIDELQFYGQTDSLCFENEDGFITLQGQDSLLHFQLKNDKLTNKGEIKGFNFPHGCALKNKKLLVTNYGDNSIDIINLKN